MTKVLITGSAGFLGHHVVKHLLKNTDWDILGIESFRHKGDSARAVRDPRYTIFTHDLSTPISYRLASQIGAVDYILNLASMSHVDTSIEDPLPFAVNNVNVALNMLEFARLAQPKKFIQFSTDEVVGPAIDGYASREWDTHVPSNPYAASKAAQENFAVSYWRTYGVPLIITRTMNLIGETQDPEKFVPMCIKKIMKGEEVTIHGNKDRIGVRHWIHSRNAADALLFIMREINPTFFKQSFTEVPKPEMFNIVGCEEINNLEMARKIADVCAVKLKYKLVDFHNSRPGHDAAYRLDGAKLKKAGWTAPIPFDESLRRVVLWTLQNPLWQM